METSAAQDGGGNVMAEELIICGFWGGECKAILSTEHPDTKKVKRDWIKRGCDEIKMLPRQAALDAFSKHWPTPPSRGEVVSEPAQKLYKCSVDHCGKEGPLVEPGKKADIVLIGLTPNNGFTVCEDCVKTMNWVVEQYHAGTLPGWCFLKGEPKP